MTESENTAPEGERANNSQLLGSRDWLLQSFVEMQNNHPEGPGLPVTLCVKGLIVTGTIVSGKVYFEGLAEITSSPDGDEESRRALHEAFHKLGGSLYKQSSEDSTPPVESPNQLAPEFIHLRDAKIFAGSTPIPTTDGTWWRGRVSEVDGFILGSLSIR